MTNEEVLQEFEIVSDLSHHHYFADMEVRIPRSSIVNPVGVHVYERMCKSCGKLFTALHGTRWSCSRKCREALYDKGRRQKRSRWSSAYRDAVSKVA